MPDSSVALRGTVLESFDNQGRLPRILTLMACAPLPKSNMTLLAQIARWVKVVEDGGGFGDAVGCFAAREFDYRTDPTGNQLDSAPTPTPPFAHAFRQSLQKSLTLLSAGR